MTDARPDYFIYILLLFFASCQNSSTESAELIIYNGDVLTMNDKQKEVEAVAIKEGKIVALGNWNSIKKYKNDNTQIKDLEGQTLLPGFIDGHSHFSFGMKMLAQANLSSPPVDSIRNIPDLINRLKEHKEKFNIPINNWVLGWGYDPDQLDEKRHPNRKELTEAFPDHPVFIMHASFHMGVANSKALALAGVDADTPNPEGGVIVREENSKKPNGLLQETAMGLVARLLPNPTSEQLFRLLDMAQDYYASFGITTVQDGFTDSVTYAFLKQAANQGAFYLDLEVLANFREAAAFAKNEKFGLRNNGLRLAGIKIITDGSPQGKTAYFKKPYLTAVPGCIHECRGFPMIPTSRLEEIMALCYTNKIQLFVHANGDASIDMLLETHQKVTDSLQISNNEQRTVVIHSQFVRKDQLDKYKSYHFVPSFFTNHTFFWGDVHTENLGKERANFLSPMKTASSLGITATNHTDYPVTPSDQLFLLWTAVQRTSRTDKIIGKTERLSTYEALKALTINSAYQHHSEDIKGSIEVGKLADFVILDRNPIKVSPDEIRNLQVLETIKEGKTIYLNKLQEDAQMPLE